MLLNACAVRRRRMHLTGIRRYRSRFLLRDSVLLMRKSFRNSTISPKRHNQFTTQRQYLFIYLLNFITDSLLHTCAGKYDSCPNHKHYNKDITLQTTDTVISYSVGPTTRHEHKAAPSSGHVLLTNIQCWRRVTLSQWYFETFQVYKQIYIQDCGLLIGSIGYW